MSDGKPSHTIYTPVMVLFAIPLQCKRGLIQEYIYTPVMVPFTICKALKWGLIQEYI